MATLQIFPPPQIVHRLTGLYIFNKKTTIYTRNEGYPIAYRLQKLLNSFALDSEITATLGTFRSNCKPIERQK